MPGFTSLAAIAATTLTAAPAIALTSTALPLASPAPEVCVPSSVFSTRELTPEESAALLQSARELVLTLSAAGGDQRATRLAAELHSIGVTPAAVTGDWRQQAHALAERVQAETHPDARRLADTLAAAGFASTVTEPHRLPQPEPSGVAATAGRVAGAAAPFVMTAARWLTSDPGDSADADPAEPEPDDAVSGSSQPDDVQDLLRATTGNGQPGLQVCTDDSARDEATNPGGTRPELLPAAEDEQDGAPDGEQDNTADANGDGDGRAGAASGPASSSGGPTGADAPSGGSSEDSEADSSAGDSTSTDDTSGTATDPEPADPGPTDPEPADESSHGPNEDTSSTGNTTVPEPVAGSGAQQSDGTDSEDSETGSSRPGWERLAAELAASLATTEDPEAAELADRLAALGITAADTGTGARDSGGSGRAEGNTTGESGTTSGSVGHGRTGEDAYSPGEGRGGVDSESDRAPTDNEQSQAQRRPSGGSAAAGSGDDS